MSFAEEVSKVTKSPEYKNTEQFNVSAATPEKTQPEAANEATEAIPQLVPGSTEPPAPAKVKMDGKEFNSVEDAYAHAKEEALKAQAKIEVYEKIQSQVKATETQTEAQKAWEEEIEQEFFVNPKEAIRKIREQAAKDAKESYTKDYQAIQAQQVREAQYAEFKKTLYADNPEIADFDTVVENIVLADQPFFNSVKDLPLKEAQDKIAEKTRSYLKLRKEASSKTTVLSSEGATFATATGTKTPATIDATQNKPLDFIAQLQQNRKRTKK